MAITYPATYALLALRATDPEAFRRRIARALKAAGSVPKAAKALEIGKRTLQTWVKKQPELANGLELQKPGNPDWVPKAPKKARKAGA